MCDDAASGRFLPGTTISPRGEPFGPASNTAIPDVGPPVDQAVGYQQAEDLTPDLSKADPAVQVAS
jgi:hypothetical protein